MAVTKIWAIHDSVSRVVDYSTNPSKTKLSDLEQVLLYAADKEKTLDEGEQQYAVTGIGCRAESAAREMAAVQRRFGKAGGNVAYHAHQSFKTGEVTAEECEKAKGRGNPAGCPHTLSKSPLQGEGGRGNGAAHAEHCRCRRAFSGAGKAVA